MLLSCVIIHYVVENLEKGQHNLSSIREDFHIRNISNFYSIGHTILCPNKKPFYLPDVQLELNSGLMSPGIVAFTEFDAHRPKFPVRIVPRTH